MNKVRTVMIDGIGIRTSLSAVEIASLPKVNAELKKENEKLKEENFNLREGIYIEKMSFPSEGRNFKELIEMPTYEELKKENEKLNHYKLLYQKVKERNMEAIELIENDLSLGVSTFGSVYSIGANKVLDILKGNNEVSNEDNRMVE